MSKRHKWHKEIKAWADGAEIEFKVNGQGEWMLLKGSPYWECKFDLFRIKPQPKEPQYLYAYKDYVRDDGSTTSKITISSTQLYNENYIGKIKLEVDD